MKYGGVIPKHIHRHPKERSGNCCQQCGWSKVDLVTNMVPLEVDHIDGDHRNNAASNLRLLRPHYHSPTATYKALN